MTLINEKDKRNNLLNNLKKEVKQLMELSVTCKFVHEDNFCFNSLCSAIESCLLHGLKKDFLNRACTFDLLKKISKDCKPAKTLVDIFIDLENNVNSDQKYFNPNSEKEGIGNIFSKMFTNTNKNVNPETINHYVPLYLSNINNVKSLWIKIAILNKSLTSIIEYILKNSSKFYHPFALVSSPVEGPLFLSLLAGPCAFDKYTRFKTIENADPDANELIRRHKLQNNRNNHIGAKSMILSPLRPPSQSKSNNSLSNLTNQNNNNNLCNIKEFIESLHQNLKSQLIYGKNYVIVNQKEKSLAGYLSMHLHPEGLILNWTPNEILNESYGEHEDISVLKSMIKSKGCWTDAFIHIEFETIAYLHCHQQNKNLMVVLVAQDGAQYPPIIFSDSQSLIQFLSSLESGLAPNFKLDPDSWESLINLSKLPIILKKVPYTYQNMNTSCLSISKQLESSHILNNSTIDLGIKESPSFNGIKPNFNEFVDNFHLSPINGDINSSISSSTPTNPNEKNNVTLKNVCNDMKYKIMSRAFYGWLNYHKQTKIVNKNLVKLVSYDEFVVIGENSYENELLLTYNENKKRLDDHLWNKLLQSKNFDENLFYKLIYEIGIETNELRKKVWPYLLGHYDFEMSDEDIKNKDKQTSDNYYKIISDWKPYEEAVKLRDEKKINLSVINHTPTPIKSPKDDDSGICSDLTTTTLSSSSESSISNQTPNTNRIFGFRTNKSKQMQTPKLLNEKTSTKKELMRLSSAISFTSTNSVESTLQEKILNNNFRLKSRSRTDLMNLRNENNSPLDLDFVNNTDNKPKFQFFDKFNAKNFLFKIMNKTNSEEDINCDTNTKLNTETEIENSKNLARQKSSSSNSKNLSVDEINKELAEMLVSNAILKAKHELESKNEVSNKKDMPIKKTLSKTDSVGNADDLLSPSPFLIHYQKPKNKLKAELSVLTTLSPISDHDGDSIELDREVFDSFALNMHRIDKDVFRCDRTYWYFTIPTNLDKLRNIIYTYTWETMDIGYIQGMCDLIAPLLVIFDSEPIVYECFKVLMKKLLLNFTCSKEMDKNFSNMRSLVQILDNELFEHINSRGDHTQFYFTYRWFLLDFKRELVYNDIFNVWETIWAFKKFSQSDNFPLFFALALVESYRDIIIENHMDFTDIIKFFNEMSEKHDIKEVLNLARALVERLREIIAEKYD